MKLAILVNDIPARVIVRTVSLENTEEIQAGTKEAQEVADSMCTALGVACEEWLIAEDDEFVLDID